MSREARRHRGVELEQAPVHVRERLAIGVADRLVHHRSDRTGELSDLLRDLRPAVGSMDPGEVLEHPPVGRLGLVRWTLGARRGERARDQAVDHPLVGRGQRRGERRGGPGVGLLVGSKLRAVPDEERARLDDALVARGDDDGGCARGERQGPGAKVHAFGGEPVEARETVVAAPGCPRQATRPPSRWCCRSRSRPSCRGCRRARTRRPSRDSRGD